MSERCAHIRVNGARCTMPALNDRDLCYQHHHRRLLRALKPMPPDYWCQTPLVAFVEMEDLRGILYNLNATADAFARHSIDYRQVSAITRLMQTCLETVQKMKRLEKEVSPEEIVRAARFDVNCNGLAESEPKAEPHHEPDAEPQPGPQPQPQSGAQSEPPTPEASAVVESIRAEADPGAEPLPFQALAPIEKLSYLFPAHTKTWQINRRIFKHLQNKKNPPGVPHSRRPLQPESQSPAQSPPGIAKHHPGRRASSRCPTAKSPAIGRAFCIA